MAGVNSSSQLYEAATSKLEILADSRSPSVGSGLEILIVLAMFCKIVRFSFAVLINARSRFRDG